MHEQKMLHLRIPKDIRKGAMLQVLHKGIPKEVQIRMNLMNVFYAFLSSVFGIILSTAYGPVMTPLINTLFTAGTANYYIAHLGSMTMIFVLILMFPIVMVFDDDARLRMRKAISGG